MKELDIPTEELWTLTGCVTHKSNSQQPHKANQTGDLWKIILNHFLLVAHYEKANNHQKNKKAKTNADIEGQESSTGNSCR